MLWGFGRTTLFLGYHGGMWSLVMGGVLGSDAPCALLGIAIGVGVFLSGYPLVVGAGLLDVNE